MTDYSTKILNTYPGLKKAYPHGITVIEASPARIKSAPQWTTNRVSEFYGKGEKGGGDMLPNPTNGSRPVLEIYHHDYTDKGKPGYKAELVLGEMLHGLKNDPHWQSLRHQFASNFSPQEVALQHKAMKQKTSDFYSEQPGETHAQMMERSGIDAYLRGTFMPKTDGEWTKAYTPKQREIAAEMMNYLKAGDKPMTGGAKGVWPNYPGMPKTSSPYLGMVQAVAHQHGLNPVLFARQIFQESGYNPDTISGKKVSPSGAKGIAQIMPSTAAAWGIDPLKPRQALDAAARNMSNYYHSYKKQGHPDKVAYGMALAAYNAGPGNVAKFKGIPPFPETKAYVNNILNQSGEDFMHHEKLTTPAQHSMKLWSNPFAMIQTRPVNTGDSL